MLVVGTLSRYTSGSLLYVLRYIIIDLSAHKIKLLKTTTPSSLFTNI